MSNDVGELFVERLAVVVRPVEFFLVPGGGREPGRSSVEPSNICPLEVPQESIQLCTGSLHVGG